MRPDKLSKPKQIVSRLRTFLQLRRKILDQAWVRLGRAKKHKIVTADFGLGQGSIDLNLNVWRTVARCLRSLLLSPCELAAMVDCSDEEIFDLAIFFAAMADQAAYANRINRHPLPDWNSPYYFEIRLHRRTGRMVVILV